MYPPQLNTEGRLWLREVRHPLLEQLIRTERASAQLHSPGGNEVSTEHRGVVPIDVRLGMGYNLLVITGPNTGGKTVCLKTVGLVCLMAQCGMHIPAKEGSQLPVFKQVLADIGDEQSLEQSLSTFSSHITRIASILEQADHHTLVLLDELGAGTDPTEGAALGRAILDHLDGSGCRAMVTTHLGDLKTYAFHNPRAENAAVEFNVETLKPTYRLLIGQFGMSNALKIAQRLNMPRTLIRKARLYLRKRTNRHSELERLQKVRQEAEAAREAALTAEHAARQQARELELKTAQLTEEARIKTELAHRRQNLQVNDRVHVARFDKEGRVVRINLAKQTVMVSIGLGQWEMPFAEITPLSASE
jgi:DNA mismatch repair protein MutS2